MTEQSIGALVRKLESDYISGTTTIGKYVQFSQYENIEKIDAYLNSVHTSGLTDSLGREKPFFNIVVGACNIWFRATDIDRKNIRIKATKAEDYTLAFVATIHLQEYMRRDAFGQFLNDWGRSLAKYGSSVLKFVEKQGQLHSSIIPWNRMISDTVNFESNPKIEKLFFTPAELRMNDAYDQDKVEELLSALETRETLDGQKKDNNPDFVELYEVHGNLPLAYLTAGTSKYRESDENTYVQQMHVLSFVKNDKGEYDEFCLIKGKEKKDPYMITHLIKEDGRSQSIGAVEYLFDAQWMVNHSAKAMKDQLDLASKLVFQTADPSFIGQNALLNIETGDILIHEENKPLTKLNNQADIASIQNFASQWQVLAKEITSTPDAISGNTMPSGTAYRQVAILNQESHSLFEIMTENKGLAIERMLREYIIPFIKKQMDTSEEISATLEAHDITKLDSMYVNAEATRRMNKKIKEAMLKDNGLGGEVAQPFDLEAEKAKIQAQLNETGNQRFLKPSDIPTETWKEVLKDFEWDVEVEITNETTDKEAIFTTLNTLLQIIASKQGQPLSPDEKLIFNKILEETGRVSPIELSQTTPATPATPAQPQPSNIQPNPAEQIGNVGGGQPAQVGGGANLPVNKY